MVADSIIIAHQDSGTQVHFFAAATGRNLKSHSFASFWRSCFKPLKSMKMKNNSTTVWIFQLTKLLQQKLYTFAYK